MTTQMLMQCEERERLFYEYGMVTHRFAREVQMTRAVAALPDPAEFITGKERERELCRILGHAAGALIQHRDEHGC